MYLCLPFWATHGRCCTNVPEVKNRRGRRINGGRLCKRNGLTAVAGSDGTSQLDLSQVDPSAIAGVAHESEFFEGNTTRIPILIPALVSEVEGGESLLLAGHLHDGQMRHVRPLLFGLQDSAIEPIVEFAEPVRAMRYPNENGRRHGDEGFDVAESDLERIHAAAGFGQRFQGCAFPIRGRMRKATRRKNRDMGGEVRKVGVQFPPKVLDELPYRVPNVSHQRVERVWHGRRTLYRAGSREGQR